MLAISQPPMLDFGSLEEGLDDLEDNNDDQRHDNDGEIYMLGVIVVMSIDIIIKMFLIVSGYGLGGQFVSKLSHAL